MRCIHIMVGNVLYSVYQFKCYVVQSLSHVQLFATPWTEACQASLFFTISQSLLKLMPIGSMMPSSQLILCCPFLLLHSMFPSIRAISSQCAVHIRWPKYWSFSFSISPPNEYSGFPLGWTGWISLLSKGLSRVFSSTTSTFERISSLALSLLYRLTLISIHDY